METVKICDLKPSRDHKIKALYFCEGIEGNPGYFAAQYDIEGLQKIMDQEYMELKIKYEIL